MRHEDIVEFYEKLKKQKVNQLEIRKRIVRKFRLKFKADGAYSKVFSKKGCRFVLKFCRGSNLPEAHTKTLKSVFIGYLYLSRDKKFGIQRKLKIKNYTSAFFNRVHFNANRKLRNTPIEDKFYKKHPVIYNRYDIHFGNLGEYKGKVFLIDF